MRCAFLLENQTWLDSDQAYEKLLRQYLSLRVERLSNPVFFSDFLYYRTARGKQEIDVCQDTQVIVKKIIQQRRRHLSDGDGMKGSPNKLTCFIDVLLTAKDENGEGMSDSDILFEANLFLFTGHDTSSAMLLWFFYFLSVHEDCQAKCREEIDEVFHSTEVLESEDLAKLTYTTQCIQEVMRICPVLQTMSRTSEKDLTIDGHVVPAGTMLSIDLLSLHRHPDFWEDPERFDPDRFSPEVAQKRHPHAYIPFSGGQRRCVGELFAMETIKMLVAHVFRNFTTKLAPGQDIRLSYKNAIAHSSCGLDIIITER